MAPDTSGTAEKTRQRQLLEALSDIRKMTISKFERGGKVLPSVVETLRMHLVAQGVEFINGGQSVGVRVPRDCADDDQRRQLREAVSAHSKVVRLIKRKGKPKADVG